jgi:hypothetical protein
MKVKPTAIFSYPDIKEWWASCKATAKDAEALGWVLYGWFNVAENKQWSFNIEKEIMDSLN